MTINELKNHVRYDPETGEFWWTKPFGAKIKPGQRVGFETGLGYRRTSINKKKYLLHVLAWAFTYGEWPRKIDHINGNGLDNRIVNLRICTCVQNGGNSRKPVTNSSGYKGVQWCARTKRWRAIVKFQQKTVHIGRFDDKVSAAIAYDHKARELFGEFARVNFPVGDEVAA